MTLYSREIIKEAEEFLEYKKDTQTKIATLTIKRPEALNAVTAGMRLLYADILHRANIDDDVKVLVLRSEGEHHGTGADLAAHRDPRGFAVADVASILRAE